MALIDYYAVVANKNSGIAQSSSPGRKTSNSVDAIKHWANVEPSINH